MLSGYLARKSAAGRQHGVNRRRPLFPARADGDPVTDGG
jgi:hypothetical protein